MQIKQVIQLDLIPIKNTKNARNYAAAKLKLITDVNKAEIIS
tara:strand:+ start:92 stop:217 length:126 start_codon:yes stop_codon:yes gene_type:complete